MCPSHDHARTHAPQTKAAELQAKAGADPKAREKADEAARQVPQLDGALQGKWVSEFVTEFTACPQLTPGPGQPRMEGRYLQGGWVGG